MTTLLGPAPGTLGLTDDQYHALAAVLAKRNKDCVDGFTHTLDVARALPFDQPGNILLHGSAADAFSTAGPSTSLEDLSTTFGSERGENPGGGGGCLPCTAPVYF